MRTVKLWIRGLGIAFLSIGGLSFPVGLGINPKRETSLFHNLANLGLFIEYGLVLIVAGMVLLLASMLIPARHEDENSLQQD